MAEGRDRLTRHEDPIDIYSRRRRSFARGGIGIFEDESPESSSRAPAETGRMTAASIGYGGIGRIGFGSPRTRRGRQSLRTPTRVIGRQNISPAGQGRSRGRHSVLPAWYPRTPLRDITAIVRVITFSTIYILSFFWHNLDLLFIYLVQQAVGVTSL